MSIVVLKFGGTSVSTRPRWETIGRIAAARQQEGHQVLLVCSAMSGVTNRLEELLPAAKLGAHEAVLGALRSGHAALAAEMGVSMGLLDDDLDELRRVATGVSLTGESTPRLTARVLAVGERLSTRLGAAFLNATWWDARDALRTEPATGHRHWLAATCTHDRDPNLRLPGPLTVTQGFVARDADGETVVLGRGGSDTSGALFAARLGAERLEIWSDVRGLYSADPRVVPDARFLEEVDYDEAQELASMGAKVLHPRCIPPVRAHGIPMLLKSTLEPDLPGTRVARLESRAPAVRAVTSRRGVTLVSMDTLGMWQQVGFLAEVFGVFAKHGLSIDLVATSETNVTCSLDAASNALDATRMQALLADLGQHCHATTLGPCAAVSLVGAHIRAALPRLGPALEAFEAQPVHLLSQAASDLNLSVVVDEAHAESLVRRLHASLFGAPQTEQRAPAPPPAETWWVRRRDALLALDVSPVYVYDRPTLVRAAAALRALSSVDRIFYAVKANAHPEVLRTFAAAGLGFECVSQGELEHVRAIAPDAPVLFTPNFAPWSEYAAAFDAGAHVTVDNLWALEAWGERFAGREVLLRLDPGVGRGHHAHVRTAGEASKFGIALADLERAREACARNGIRVVGLHAHAGSGILDPDTWAFNAEVLATARALFPEVRVIDVGGGLGVGERDADAGVDLAALDAHLTAFRARAALSGVELWMEPGRWLVARAGVLLTRVTQLKSKMSRSFVGVDAGMHTLLRPALYGAWHEVTNLTRLGEPATALVDVVGPICETGDVLGTARLLPPTHEGDVLVFTHAGAYGRAMSSTYNQRALPAERVLEAETPATP